MVIEFRADLASRSVTSQARLGWTTELVVWQAPPHYFYDTLPPSIFEGNDLMIAILQVKMTSWLTDVMFAL
jgi:hypothetical protein